MTSFGQLFPTFWRKTSLENTVHIVWNLPCLNRNPSYYALGIQGKYKMYRDRNDNNHIPITSIILIGSSCKIMIPNIAVTIHRTNTILFKWSFPIVYFTKKWFQSLLVLSFQIYPYNIYILPKYKIFVFCWKYDTIPHTLTTNRKVIQWSLFLRNKMKMPQSIIPFMGDSQPFWYFLKEILFIDLGWNNIIFS